MSGTGACMGILPRSCIDMGAQNAIGKPLAHLLGGCGRDSRERVASSVALSSKTCRETVPRAA